MSNNQESYPYEENGYTLYSNAKCPYAQRALRAFKVAKVPHKVVEIDLQNKPTWYKLVNPQLKVPSLRTPDGTILIESLVIAEFVADQFPEAKLLSTDAIERAQLRLFIELFSSRISPVVYRILGSAEKADIEANTEKILEGVRAVSKELETQWGRNSGKGGPFWYGDKFGYAEIATSSFAGLLVPLKYYRGVEVPKTEEYAAYNRWFDAVSKDAGFTEFKPSDEELVEAYKRDEESDDDDLIGPSAALSGYSEADAKNQTLSTVTERLQRQENNQNNQADDTAKREEWMLVPPSAESSKQIKGRKGAAAPLFDKSWTETPEEKRERKNKERNKGKGESSSKHGDKVEEETPSMRRKRKEDEDKARWVNEYNRQQRPKSLLEMHLESKSDKKRRGREHRDRDRRDRRESRDDKKSDKRKRRSDDEDDYGHSGDAEGDEWKRQRFDRSRDLNSGKIDGRRQREMLNSMAFLSDKYAPGKGGSFM
ncbi:hypothetical protein GGI07_003041 [Coemansia sp. Benny D115]|nr:hypothetical protein GGI07_003041 [Coemansia sp. Benny D115]